jgi:hypothetical protein
MEPVLGAQTMAKPLKVYLLDVRPAPSPPVFFSGPPEDDGEDPPPPHRGLHGWAESRLRRIRSKWEHAEGRAVRLIHHAWNWLQRHTHPDEVLLARLRKAHAIEVYHPASMSAEEAASEWSAFLAASRRRHWPWFIVNALIAPLTVALAPLPGPNLIGYWFAYRAVHHWLILIGLGKVRKGRVETNFLPTETLDLPVEPREPGSDLGHVTAPLDKLGCDSRSVEDFLDRHGLRPVKAEP